MSNATNATQCAYSSVPDQDISGIGVSLLFSSANTQVRISAYIEIIAVIAVILISRYDSEPPEGKARDLIRATFRNTFVLTFAITTALLIAQRQQGYSLQSGFVIGALVVVLQMSLWAIIVA